MPLAPAWLRRDEQLRRLGCHVVRAHAALVLRDVDAALVNRTELDVLREALVAESIRVAGMLSTGVAALQEQEPEVDRTDLKKLRLDEWAYVGDSGDEIERATVGAAGQRPEAGKHAARQLIHFFSPEGAILPVFIAARKLLTERYGFTIGPDAYRATRLDPDAIRKAELELVAAGYLGNTVATTKDEAARIVSHREDGLETFLRVAWPRFVELALVFGQYQSPDGRPIGPGRIASYLRQFEHEGNARAALRMLEGIEVVDRRGLATSLETHLGVGSDVATVCSLGGPGDSSAFVSYLMNDLPSEKRRKVRDLELALDEGTDQGILLWDDFCGQGRHTITVLAQWLGLQDELLLAEDLVERLTDRRTESFRSRPIHIAFAMVRTSGARSIEEFLTRHGLANVKMSPGARVVEETNRLFDTDSIIPLRLTRRSPTCTRFRPISFCNQAAKRQHKKPKGALRFRKAPLVIASA